MVDPHGPEPAYIQLANQLRADITSGRLKARDPIPSIQDMVAEYDLAVGTVRHAVRVLIDEGLVYTVPGRGTFVAGKS